MASFWVVIERLRQQAADLRRTGEEVRQGTARVLAEQAMFGTAEYAYVLAARSEEASHGQQTFFRQLTGALDAFAHNLEVSCQNYEAADHFPMSYDGVGGGRPPESTAQPLPLPRPTEPAPAMMAAAQQGMAARQQAVAWEAFSHEQLVQMLTAGDAASINRLAGRWRSAGEQLFGVSDTLNSQASDLVGPGWEGPAARAYEQRVSELAETARQAGVAARNNASTMDVAAMALSEAQAAMSQPYDKSELVEATKYMSLPTYLMDRYQDAKAQERKHEAVRVMRQLSQENTEVASRLQHPPRYEGGHVDAPSQPPQPPGTDFGTVYPPSVANTGLLAGMTTAAFLPSQPPSTDYEGVVPSNTNIVSGGFSTVLTGGPPAQPPSTDCEGPHSPTTVNDGCSSGTVAASSSPAQQPPSTDCEGAPSSTVNSGSPAGLAPSPVDGTDGSADGTCTDSADGFQGGGSGSSGGLWGDSTDGCTDLASGGGLTGVGGAMPGTPPSGTTGGGVLDGAARGGGIRSTAIGGAAAGGAVAGRVIRGRVGGAGGRVGGSVTGRAGGTISGHGASGSSARFGALGGVRGDGNSTPPGTTRNGASANTSGPRGRMPWTPLRNADNGDDEGEKRYTWLREQDDVWGANEDAVAPHTVGAEGNPYREPDSVSHAERHWPQEADSPSSGSTDSSGTDNTWGANEDTVDPHTLGIDGNSYRDPTAQQAPLSDTSHALGADDNPYREPHSNEHEPRLHLGALWAPGKTTQPGEAARQGGRDDQTVDPTYSPPSDSTEPKRVIVDGRGGRRVETTEPDEGNGTTQTADHQSSDTARPKRGVVDGRGRRVEPAEAAEPAERTHSYSQSTTEKDGTS